MSEEQEFEMGDIVKLKSGGPPMTVNENRTIELDRMVQCIWFCNDGKVEKSWFPFETLEPVDVATG